MFQPENLPFAAWLAGMAWLDAPTPFMRMRTPAPNSGSVPSWQRPISSTDSGKDSLGKCGPAEGGVARVLAPQNLFKGVPCDMS